MAGVLTLPGRQASSAGQLVASFDSIRNALDLHRLREGAFPASLAELQSADREPFLDPWGQPYLYLPRRDGAGNVTDYALISLGPDAGRGETFVTWRDPGHWRDGGVVSVPEQRVERATAGGAGLGHLLPPLLSAGLAGTLGLGVWLLGRMPAWRRAAVFEPQTWTADAPGPRVAVHRAASTVHCAWCHDSASDLPLLACRGCGTVLHGERATMVQVDRSEPVDAVPGGLS
jgi:hypothetical protein